MRFLTLSDSESYGPSLGHEHLVLARADRPREHSSAPLGSDSMSCKCFPCMPREPRAQSRVRTSVSQKKKNVSRFEKPVVPLSQLRHEVLVGSRAERALAPDVEK